MTSAKIRASMFGPVRCEQRAKNYIAPEVL